jgi:diacylglycerol kinase family enzyme
MIMWHRTWVVSHRSALGRGPNRPALPAAQAEAATPVTPKQNVALVVNPIKSGAEDFIVQLITLCRSNNFSPPKVYETTVENPGAKQAMTAIAEGADVVIAAGGDGTVRSVATAMVHTGVPMAIIPLGTGNLLARNLDFPISSMDKLINIAVFGNNTPIDVGWVQITPEGEKETSGANPSKWDPQLFTVIIGVGFDAALVQDTEDKLKRRIGWLAYFMAAAQNLYYDLVKATVTIDEFAPSVIEARTIMVGNCGKLPGGVTLLPNAKLDDGMLDLAAVDTKAGLTGWAGLFGTVVLQGAGIHSDNYPKTGEIQFAQAEHVRVEMDRPAHAQIDGDPIGMAEILDAWVDKGALLVRTPPA